MKKRRTILVGIIILVVIVAFVLLRPNEPTYAGKPVSHWLRHRESVMVNADGKEVSLQGMIDELETKTIFQYVFKEAKRVNRLSNERYIQFWKKLPEPVQVHLSPPFDDDFGKSSAFSFYSEVLWMTGASGIPNLIEGMKSRNAGVREVSNDVLWRYLKEDYSMEDYIPDLIELLDSDDPLVRRYGAKALITVGPRAEAAVPSLVGLLSDRKSEENPYIIPDIRASSAIALGEIGVASEEVISGLKDLSENLTEPIDIDYYAAIQAALSVRKLTGDSDYTVRRLIDLWPDVRTSEKMLTLQSLGELGPAAKEAIPLLTDILENGIPEMASVEEWIVKPYLAEAKKALEAIDPENPLIKSSESNAPLPLVK